MSTIIQKLLLVAIIWGVFIYVILQIPYPETITQATLFQLFSFFFPLFTAISLTFNFFLQNIFFSSSISLGIIFILILNALQSLNIVTGGLTVVSVGLLISYFKKSKGTSLTNHLKIPKLTKLRKEKS